MAETFMVAIVFTRRDHSASPHRRFNNQQQVHSSFTRFTSSIRGYSPRSLCR